MKRPNFSGRWEFDPKKSTLETPPPENSTFIIRHQEPVFHLSRIHIVDGKKDTFTLEIKTDGKYVSFTRGEVKVEASLYWEGSDLLFDSILTRDGSRASNVVRYRLEDQGETFIGDEKFNSKDLSYHNIWVFKKQQTI